MLGGSEWDFTIQECVCVCVRARVCVCVSVCVAIGKTWKPLSCSYSNHDVSPEGQLCPVSLPLALPTLPFPPLAPSLSLSSHRMGPSEAAGAEVTGVGMSIRVAERVRWSGTSGGVSVQESRRRRRSRRRSRALLTLTNTHLCFWS